jgi:hypothetical protein
VDDFLNRIFGGLDDTELDAVRRQAAEAISDAWVDGNEALVDECVEEITEWRKRGDRWHLPIWWVEGKGRPWASCLWVEFNLGESTVKAHGHDWAVGKVGA